MPWKCPACRVWLAAAVARHDCDGGIATCDSQLGEISPTISASAPWATISVSVPIGYTIGPGISLSYCVTGAS
jgi:hypothetical protein